MTGLCVRKAAFPKGAAAGYILRFREEPSIIKRLKSNGSAVTASPLCASSRANSEKAAASCRSTNEPKEDQHRQREQDGATDSGRNPGHRTTISVVDATDQDLNQICEGHEREVHPAMHISAFAVTKGRQLAVRFGLHFASSARRGTGG
jgi:hypothetical protein